MREKLKDLLDRKRTCLPYVEESTVQSAPAAFSISQEMGTLGEVVMPEHVQNMSPANAAIPDQSDEAASSPSLTVPEWHRKLNREKRYALYEDVKALRKQGLSHYAIADTLGISRPTVRRFLAAGSFPNVSLAPNDRGRALWLPICLSFVSAGRLDVTTDATSSVKPKRVATPAHRLNLNESPRSGASTFLLRFQEAQHHPTRLQ